MIAYDDIWRFTKLYMIGYDTCKFTKLSMIAYGATLRYTRLVVSGKNNQPFRGSIRS
jgi:hypothetical protein